MQLGRLINSTSYCTWTLHFITAGTHLYIRHIIVAATLGQLGANLLSLTKRSVLSRWRNSWCCNWNSQEVLECNGVGWFFVCGVGRRWQELFIKTLSSASFALRNIHTHKQARDHRLCSLISLSLSRLAQRWCWPMFCNRLNFDERSANAIQLRAVKPAWICTHLGDKPLTSICVSFQAHAPVIFRARKNLRFLAKSMFLTGFCSGLNRHIK